VGIVWHVPCSSTLNPQPSTLNPQPYAAGPLQPLLYPQSVSIVVPCYNCAEFVLLAFESFERSFNLLHDLVHRLGTR
jgi:hypothetical protein